MARIAVSIALIFSLFLISHARLQPKHDPRDNQLVEWKPSISFDLPVSTSDSNAKPNLLLLPSEKPKEDALLSEEVAELESTDAAELPGSEDATVVPQEIESRTTISSIDDERLEHHKKHKKHGGLFHFRFPFGFHKHCHHHKKDRKHKDDEEKEEKHKKHGFRLFHFFHKHCHHHKKDKHKEMEKQFEKHIAGEEIPYDGDMIKARTAGFLHGKRFHHHNKPVGEGEQMMRLGEGKIKHQKKWKKEKKHSGLIKWFRKFFKHFH